MWQGLAAPSHFLDQREQALAFADHRPGVRAAQSVVHLQVAGSEWLVWKIIFTSDSPKLSMSLSNPEVEMVAVLIRDNRGRH